MCSRGIPQKSHVHYTKPSAFSFREGVLATLECVLRVCSMRGEMILASRIPLILFLQYDLLTCVIELYDAILFQFRADNIVVQA